MEWTCPVCGRTGLTSSFCGTCGNPQPELNSTPSLNINSSPTVSFSSDRFHEYSNPDGSKTIIDNLNDYTINYTEAEGYAAYDKNGDCVYIIDNNGTAFINLKHYNDDGGFIISDSPLTIEDIDKNMCIKTGNGGYVYYLSDRYVKKIDSFKEDGSLVLTRFFEVNGDYQFEWYNDDGSIDINYYKKDDKLYKKVHKSADGNDKTNFFGTIDNQMGKGILSSIEYSLFKIFSHSPKIIEE